MNVFECFRVRFSFLKCAICSLTYVYLFKKHATFLCEQTYLWFSVVEEAMAYTRKSLQLPPGQKMVTEETKQC